MPDGCNCAEDNDRSKEGSSDKSFHVYAAKSPDVLALVRYCEAGPKSDW
jgi:hypothetical protein